MHPRPHVYTRTHIYTRTSQVAFTMLPIKAVCSSSLVHVQAKAEEEGVRLWQVQDTHILPRLQVMLIGLHARVCVTCNCVYVGICVLQEPIQQHQRPASATSLSMRFRNIRAHAWGDAMCLCVCVIEWLHKIHEICIVVM